MDSSENSPSYVQFGNGEFEFGEWLTPFTNSSIEIWEVICSPIIRRFEDVESLYYKNSLFRSPIDADLKARIYNRDTQKVYLVTFPRISAMRVLDEGGLLELWEKTRALGGRPGQTTFRVRNHAWTNESIVSFLTTEDGWSYLIASDDACLEVLSNKPPKIIEEQTDPL